MESDSLSPFLFNLIMDEVIDSPPKLLGYQMDNTVFNIVCYADVLLTDSEDSLLRFLHTFNTSPKQNNMIINIKKTKCYQK